MGNMIYESTKAKLLASEIDWENGGIKAALVDCGGIVAAIADVKGRKVVLGHLLGNVLTLDGVGFQADAVVFQTVNCSCSIEKVVIYDEAKGVICEIGEAVGLPVIPNGGDIIVSWGQGPFLSGAGGYLNGYQRGISEENEFDINKVDWEAYGVRETR